jgi:hypothetical protein
MKNLMGLNKIILGISICLAAASETSNANLIDSAAWIKSGNVTDYPAGPVGFGFFLVVSSTGIFGGTPSASISQTINTTPGDSYEVQFFTTGFSFTHPFNNIGQFQFDSSAVTFAGGDDHGTSSKFDSIFVATGEQTLITLSFDANPAYGFLQTSVVGPSANGAINVVDLPDTCLTAALLMLGMTGLFVARRFTGLKSCSSDPSSSNS